MRHATALRTFQIPDDPFPWPGTKRIEPELLMSAGVGLIESASTGSPAVTRPKRGLGLRRVVKPGVKRTSLGKG